MIHRAEGAAVALYRLFDDGGSLLYAGISKDPMHRWGEHSGNYWWAQVFEYTVTWYPSRAEARAAEKAALATEEPRHNVHSTPGHSAHWKAALGSPDNRAARATRAQQIATGLRGSKRPKAAEREEGGSGG